MESLKDKLPVILRYAVAIVASLLAGAGLIGSDALPPALQEQLVGFILSAIAVVPLIWALIKRPSAKAMEVAKEVDASIPKDQTVVIQTPAGQPDIIVPPTK